MMFGDSRATDARMTCVRSFSFSVTRARTHYTRHNQVNRSHVT
jgi:hypothetical protein